MELCGVQKHSRHVIGVGGDLVTLGDPPTYIAPDNFRQRVGHSVHRWHRPLNSSISKFEENFVVCLCSGSNYRQACRRGNALCIHSVRASTWGSRRSIATTRAGEEAASTSSTFTPWRDTHAILATFTVRLAQIKMEIIAAPTLGTRSGPGTIN